MFEPNGVLTMQFLQAATRSLRFAAVAFALGVSIPVAHAQQPTATAKATAKEIAIITGSNSMFTPLIAGVIEQARLLLLQQNPNLSKVLTEISDKLRSDLQPRMDELVNEVANQYTSRFSEQELKDLLAFHKSPIGRKLMAEQPAIADASLKFAQTWANSLSDEVVGKMRDELKRRGHAL
jgi:hypothetical protein